MRRSWPEVYYFGFRIGVLRLTCLLACFHSKQLSDISRLTLVMPETESVKVAGRTNRKKAVVLSDVVVAEGFRTGSILIHYRDRLA